MLDINCDCSVKHHHPAINSELFSLLTTVSHKPSLVDKLEPLFPTQTQLIPEEAQKSPRSSFNSAHCFPITWSYAPNNDSLINSIQAPINQTLTAVPLSAGLSSPLQKLLNFFSQRGNAAPRVGRWRRTIFHDCSGFETALNDLRRSTTCQTGYSCAGHRQTLDGVAKMPWYTAWTNKLLKLLVCFLLCNWRPVDCYLHLMRVISRETGCLEDGESCCRAGELDY